MLFYILLDHMLIKLWRLNDPKFGDLKIPQFDQPTKDKTLIPTNSTFKVNVENKEVSILSDGKCYCAGKTITYLL